MHLNVTSSKVVLEPGQVLDDAEGVHILLARREGVTRKAIAAISSSIPARSSSWPTRHRRPGHRHDLDRPARSRLGDIQEKGVRVISREMTLTLFTSVGRVASRLRRRRSGSGSPRRARRRRGGSAPENADTSIIRVDLGSWWKLAHRRSTTGTRIPERCGAARLERSGRSRRLECAKRGGSHRDHAPSPRPGRRDRADRFGGMLYHSWCITRRADVVAAYRLEGAGAHVQRQRRRGDCLRSYCASIAASKCRPAVGAATPGTEAYTVW